MTKQELAEKLVEIYTNSGTIITASLGIFTFTYGEYAVDKFTPTELIEAAHAINPEVKTRYGAELNAAFAMYRYFKSHPNLFALGRTGLTKGKEIKGLARQLITYGAPGTGKSYKVDGLADNPDVAACARTTFHPDSDYSTFVGSYKPSMVGERIAYTFRPQAFMNAYVKAWQEMATPNADGKVKNVVLVIEEINRGNCAQIFGDLFQLLDRGNGGYSTYPIDADIDLATWLAEEKQFGNQLAGLAKPEDIKKSDDWNDILIGKKLALPPNLYIWATMNTSDQSLFPIDSAFKRRWDWEYVPISKPDKSDDPDWKDRKIEVGNLLFDWWDFVVAINGHIAKATESEDKQLGYFFAKADDATGYISAKTFANKVLFYLYGDVFKSYELPKDDCFKVDGRVLSFRDFFYGENTVEGEGADQVTRKPGEVKLDVLASFLRGLKWDGKGVAETDKPVPPETHAETPNDGGASVTTEET